MCLAGRLRYFYSTTSPLTLLASSKQLEQAQTDVRRYEGLIKERGREGCWVGEKDRDEYWRAKQCGCTRTVEEQELERV